MLTTIRYALINLVKTPAILVWTLLFPLILSSVFMLMFSSIDELASQQTVPIVVVTPDDDEAGQTFQAFLDQPEDVNAQEGGVPLFAITYAESQDKAQALVVGSLQAEQPYAGYVMLQDGLPRVFVADDQSSSGNATVSASVLVLVMDTYCARLALVSDLLADNPLSLADPEVVQSLSEQALVTQQVQLTQHQPQETVRFYFALLGMAALFGGSVGLTAVQSLRPNTSSLGARRSVGALSYAKSVAGTILACWIMCFACLAITFAYMRFVVNLDFGGRDIAALMVLATASLLATALGCAVSAIPKLPESAKSGILTGIVCFASLFAGLYGEPTMELADTISKAAPALDYINPATQISQAFYSIMYYDSFEPLMLHLVVLVTMTVVFFALSVQALRRQRYASL